MREGGVVKALAGTPGSPPEARYRSGSSSADPQYVKGPPQRLIEKIGSGLRSCRAGDQGDVPSGVWSLTAANRFTHHAFAAISQNGSAKTLASHEHDPPGRLRLSGRWCPQYKKRRVRYPAPTGEEPVDLAVRGQSPHVRPVGRCAGVPTRRSGRAPCGPCGGARREPHDLLWSTSASGTRASWRASGC